MLAKTFALLCLFNQVVFCQDRNPPTDGKYFYADYRGGSGYGVKYLNMQISEGDSRRKMWVFATTSQSEVGIITTECPNPAVCDVPSPFDVSKVKLLTPDDPIRYQTDTVRFFD
jgi:hypothetical protein